eukprot:4485409-Amphidinium_carterae.2
MLLKLATACKRISPKFFGGTTQEDLHTTLAKLEHENVQLPQSLKHSIVMRKVNVLVKEQKFAQLVQVLNPWIEEPFNWRSPMVAGFNMTVAGKFTTFREILFEKVIGQLIARGEEDKRLVVQISEQALLIGNAVDLVEQDVNTVRLLAECESAWKCLLGLASASVDASCLDQHLYECKLVLVNWAWRQMLGGPTHHRSMCRRCIAAVAG